MARRANRNDFVLSRRIRKDGFFVKYISKVLGRACKKFQKKSYTERDIILHSFIQRKLWVTRTFWVHPHENG